MIATPFTFYFHFSGLKWGTPNVERTSAIFKSEAEIESFIPRMMELRQNYYKSVEAVVDPKQPFRENYRKAYQRHSMISPFALIPTDGVLDQIRGYLIGVDNSDEQNTLIALTQLKSILKANFIPSFATFYYGGSYLFLCGALAGLGKITGFLTLTPNIDFYFTHPEEIQKMYFLLRAIGPVVLFLSAVFLLLTLKRRYSLPTAILGVIFYLWQPGWIYYGHSAKPHVFAAALLTIGLFFCVKILTKPGLKDYLCAGLVFGACAGSLVVNIPIIAMLFLSEFMRLDYNWREFFRSKPMWLGTGVFVLVYLITNFHFFIYFQQFRRLLMAWQEFGTGYGHLIFANIPLYLKDIWTAQIPWFFIPMITLGMLISLKKREKLGILCLMSWITLFSIDLISTRHWGVNLRTIPFYAVFFTIAIQWLLETKNQLLRGLSLAYITTALTLSAIQCDFYVSQFRSPMTIEEPSSWINSNIPKESSIGIINGSFGPASLSAFRFLDYDLVNFPSKEPPIQPKFTDLPRYVVLNGEPSSEFIEDTVGNFYRLKAIWPRRKALFGLTFRLIWDNAGPVRVYEKI